MLPANLTARPLATHQGRCSQHRCREPANQLCSSTSAAPITAGDKTLEIVSSNIQEPPKSNLSPASILNVPLAQLETQHHAGQRLPPKSIQVLPAIGLPAPHLRCCEPANKRCRSDNRETGDYHIQGGGLCNNASVAAGKPELPVLEHHPPPVLATNAPIAGPAAESQQPGLAPTAE